MKQLNLFVAASLLLSATAAQAQTLPVFKADRIVKAFILNHATPRQASGLDMTGMDILTTKACHTTTYTYTGSDWQQQATTQTEYNTKGYVTATEIRGKDKDQRTEYTYDDTLEGLVTKTVAYTWDAATSTWTDSVTTARIDLTRDGKGRVSKETVYAYDEDSKTLEKVSEVEFGYSILTGKLNSVSTTLNSEDEQGNTVSIPVKVTILKWYKYDANKLFNFSMDNLGASLLDDKDNMIESATVTMTYNSIPLTGTISGKYTDTTSDLTFELPFMTQTVMKMQASVNVTDNYGSNKSTINIDMMGNNVLTATVTNTNNEHGDCIKTETSGTGNDDFDFGTDNGFDFGTDPDLGLDLDMNQSLTYNYEYYELPDNKTLKKSVVTNVLDKNTQTFRPTLKTTYDQYVDYVSGVTHIEGINENVRRSDTNGVYSLNGIKTDSYTASGKKGLYIVKEGGKTKKVIR